MRNPPRLFCVGLALCSLIACGESQLSTQRPRIFVEPITDTGQTASENPAGLDLGQVPLFGVETARFTVRNRGTARLEISGINPLEVSAGSFEIIAFPDTLGPSESGELILEFSPSADAVVDQGTFEIQSNDDEAGIANQFLVRGTGVFVGTPTLEVCYNGTCRPADGECVDGRAIAKGDHLGPSTVKR
ncbi:MAG: choice-of-anchor D domain-containing protein, partial [Myxococcota bacterium]